MAYALSLSTDPRRTFSISTEIVMLCPPSLPLAKAIICLYSSTLRSGFLPSYSSSCETLYYSSVR